MIYKEVLYSEPASKLLSKQKHMKQKEKILFFLTPTLVL